MITELENSFLYFCQTDEEENYFKNALIYLCKNDEEGSLERRFFYMYYTTADETQFTTDRLIDVATFIASVGGTLGLYLGFSFLGLLFPLYDYAEASYTKWKRKAKKRSN